MRRLNRRTEASAARRLSVPSRTAHSEASRRERAERRRAAPTVSELPAVEIHSGDSTVASATLRVVPADPPAVEAGGGAPLETRFSFLSTEVTVGGKPGSLAFLFTSPSLNPTVLEGIASLGGTHADRNTADLQPRSAQAA